MRKLYIITTVILVVLTIILSVPGVALMSALFTFGLAIRPMVQILKLTIILVCCLPVVIAWPNKIALIPAVAVTIGLLLLAFYVPNNSAKNMRDQILAEAPQTPASPITDSLPRTVEIIRTSSPNADLGDRVIGHGLCDEICQSLLLGETIDWVRIRLTNDAFGNDETKTTARFALAPAMECRELYAAMPVNNPCVVFRDDTKVAADLVIEIQENHWLDSWGDGDFGRVKPAGKRVVVARFGTGEDATVAFLRTQLFYEIPSRNLVFNFGGLTSGNAGGGIMYTPEKGRGPAIHITDELKTLGIPLGGPFVRTKPLEHQESWEVPPDPWQSAMAASLFETAPEGDDYRHKWGNAKTWHINDWLYMARAIDTLSATDMRILCQAKTDERMNHISWLDQIERKHGPLVCP